MSQLKILQSIPANGSIAYSKLAKAANVPEHQLRSVVRMAITSNFLSESTPDCVAHNHISELFVESHGWLQFMTRFSWPSALTMADATQKWGGSGEKTHTSFNIAMNTDVSFFKYFAETSDLSNQFSAYMKSIHSSYGTSLKHLVSGFDWASVGNGTVVDVSLAPSNQHFKETALGSSSAKCEYADDQ